MSGTAGVEQGIGRFDSFEAGQAIHVPPGIEHQVRGDRGVEVVSVGGPCPADFVLLKSIGLWPRG